MDDLITWLKARLDEDERAARIIEPGGGYLPVTWTAEPAKSGTWTHVVARYQFADDPVEAYETQVVAMARDGRLEYGHIARWDPARVLREVEARRRLLDGPLTGSGPDQYTEWEWTLKVLALPYSDRPGYQDRWRP